MVTSYIQRGMLTAPVVLTMAALAITAVHAAGPTPEDVGKAMQELVGKTPIAVPGQQPPVLGAKSLGPPPAASVKLESHDVLEIDYGKDLRLLAAPPRPGNLGARTIVATPRQRPAEQPRVDVQIPFRINSFELIGNAPQLLDKVAEALKAAGAEKVRISVNGHTDRTTGTYQWNMVLSKLRAASVMKYLVERGGVDVARLEGRGYGPNAPRHDESTRDGVEGNRRVEFELLAGQ